MNYSRLFNIAFVIWLISIFSLGCIVGYDYGKIHEQKAILERLEEVDSTHRQDSIKQQIDISIMACDCIKRLNQELRKEFNDSVEVDTQLHANLLTVNLWAHYYKQNKNGTYRKGLSKIMLVPRYCPFCGKPYFEEEKP